MSTQKILEDLDPETLKPIVGASAGLPSAGDGIELTRGWSVRRIGGQAHEGTLGVFQLSGTAAATGGATPWSIVVKAMAPGDDPRLKRQIARESRAYSIAERDPQAGMRAARCYGQTDRGAGEHWLWLEDLTHATGPPWALADYLIAAERLGVWQSAAGGALAEREPWMGSPSLVGFCSAAPIEQRVRSLREPQDALRAAAHAALPPDANHWLDLWQGRGEVLALLGRLPELPASNDCHNGNFFIVEAEADRRVLVGIDWAYLGRGPVGGDAGTMVVSDLLWLRQKPADFAAMEPLFFDRYVRALGADADRDRVRLGYLLLGGVGGVFRVMSGLADYLAAHLTADLAPGAVRADRDVWGRVAMRFRGTLEALAPLVTEAEALADRLFGVRW